MSALHSTVAGIMGLDAPELVLVMVILAFLAALIAVVLWVILRITKRNDGSSVSLHTHKKCPDCAEFVLVEARVCKHCGFRFDRGPSKIA